MSQKRTIKSKDWKAKAKGLLKAELHRRNLRYPDLAKKLTAMGVEETHENIKKKITRGTFSAVFFLQCLDAIGCTTLHIEDV